MKKAKKVYFCTQCGLRSSKWLGKCHVCGSWNSFQEQIVTKSGKKSIQGNSPAIPYQITEIENHPEPRMQISDQELTRVLGGGIVPGSVILLGGHPGIGKSTLLLQMALDSDKRVLYLSGEESLQQIKLRADRLNKTSDKCYFLAETRLQEVLKIVQNLKPEFLIIDSIQTLTSDLVESTPGSIAQIRECTGELIQYAKSNALAILIIGHITKEGTIAGPKILEHMVDVVLQFEGDSHNNYRMLRSIKNRFGSTEELGIYEMSESGMNQVTNPSQLLLTQSQETLSGSSVAAAIEGMRPLFIETQALVTPAVYGTPQRSSTGWDLRRLNMLLAVLEKRCGFHFGSQDVFLNIAGGLRVQDPAIDLAVAAALISSLEDFPISSKMAFTAEIGLTGEVRAVNRIEQRVQEAQRLGFDQIIISEYNYRNIHRENDQIEILPLTKINQLYDVLMDLQPTPKLD